MRCRDHIALTLPSFLLRLTLAITFLWAGTGKIVGTSTSQADNAARLANLGVTFIQPAPELPESSTPDEPAAPLPDTEIDTDLDSEPESETDIATPPPPQTDPAESRSEADPETEPQAESNPVALLPIITPVAQTTSPAVGSDYPEPVTYKNLYKIALLLDHSTSPGLTEDSQPITPTMPSWLGSGRMPVYAAWATAITEIAAGFFLLIGLFTRLSALSLMIVMLVAMWTTQIGPAALQSSDAILGFIPNVDDPWSPAAYTKLLWQLALVIMSLSVLLLGPGPLSLDRIFFRPNRRDPYVSGESKQAPKPQPTPPPEPHKDRTEFDRAPPPQNNPTP